MYFLIITFLFCCLTIGNTVFLIKNLRKTGWSIFNYSVVYLILFFNVIPIVTLLIPESIISSYRIPDFHKDSLVLLYIFLVILCGFIAYYTGYFFTKSKGGNIVIYKRIGKKPINEILIFVLLAFSIIGLVLYVSGFGSLNSAIANANLVRSGAYKKLETGDTSYTFYFRFIFLAVIPFVYYFTLHKKKLYHKLVLGSSITVLIILYLFLSPGRQSILDLFLIFIFSSLIIKREIINFRLIGFGILALLVLPILNSFLSFGVLVSEDRLGHRSIINTFIGEFGFPFYSLYYAVVEHYQYFLFSDFLSGLFGHVFPSSLGLGMEKTNYLNTYFMTGRKERGYVPPGLFAQGYYSLGIVGVVLISFFTGWFFKKIDSLLQNLINIDYKYVFFYALLITNSLAWIRTGLPYNYFYNFVFMSFWIFLFSSIKIRKRG